MPSLPSDAIPADQSEFLSSVAFWELLVRRLCSLCHSACDVRARVGEPQQFGTKRLELWPRLRIDEIQLIDVFALVDLEAFLVHCLDLLSKKIDVVVESFAALESSLSLARQIEETCIGSL